MSSAWESGPRPPSDAEIVAALLDGDSEALGVVYDRYASALHTFAYSMVRSRERAADVTHDSFVVAAARIHQLRDPDRLRPWLYAIVRSECLRSLRGSRREVAFQEWHDTGVDSDADAGLRRDEIRELVRDALGGLSPKDREIVELSLRHDLDNAEIAAVLGAKPTHVTALTSRARRSLERSLGALLVAQAGGVGCDELTDILSPWDGQWTPLWRKRISKHIDDCPVCLGERRRRFQPAAILIALPLLAVPVGLRVRTVSDAEPQLVAAVRHPGPAQAATPDAPMPDVLDSRIAPSPVTMSGNDPRHERTRRAPTTVAGRAAWTYPVADPPRRRWMILSGVAALLVVVVGSALLLLTVPGDPPSPPVPAVDIDAPATATVGEPHTSAPGATPHNTGSSASAGPDSSRPDAGPAGSQPVTSPPPVSAQSASPPPVSQPAPQPPVSRPPVSVPPEVAPAVPGPAPVVPDEQEPGPGRIPEGGGPAFDPRVQCAVCGSLVSPPGVSGNQPPVVN